MFHDLLPKLDIGRVVDGCEMLEFDGRTLRVDVTGWTPVVEAARRLHLSEYTALDASQYLQDIFGSLAEKPRHFLALGILTAVLGECYRRAFRIQPTRYASASGVGSAVGSASPPIVE